MADIFTRTPIMVRGTPENQAFTHETLFYDSENDLLFSKIVGGVVPPNQDGPGYMVIAGMIRPISGQVPHIWLLAETACNSTQELLSAMSKAHGSYKTITYYARFHKTKEGYRVFDRFARHVAQFNMEAAAKRMRQVVTSDAQWVGDRGELAYNLERLHGELQINNRTVYWNEPSPPSITALSGIDEWERVTDEKNTMVGALCYAVCGLLGDRPLLDASGKLTSTQSTQKTKHGRVPFNEWMKRNK